MENHTHNLNADHDIVMHHMNEGTEHAEFGHEHIFPFSKYRKFSENSKPKPKDPKLCESLNVMSYNILSDSLIEFSGYEKKDYPFLNIKFRADNYFINEIDPLDPDIILFQEKQDCDTHTLKHLIQRNYGVPSNHRSSSSSRAWLPGTTGSSPPTSTSSSPWRRSGRWSSHSTMMPPSASKTLPCSPF